MPTVLPVRVSSGECTLVSVGEDAVVVVQTVGKAEFDIDPRLALVIRDGLYGGVVVAQVPVFVIDVHLHVERKANMPARVEHASGIEDDLGVILPTDPDWIRAPQRRHIRLRLRAHRVIREPKADVPLHVIRQALIDARTVDQLGALQRPRGDDHLGSVEAPLLPGQRARRPDLVPAERHIEDALDERVEANEEALAVRVGAWRQACLIDQELCRVEDAGGFNEELVPRRAVWVEIRLV